MGNAFIAAPSGAVCLWYPLGGQTRVLCKKRAENPNGRKGPFPSCALPVMTGREPRAIGAQGSRRIPEKASDDGSEGEGKLFDVLCGQAEYPGFDRHFAKEAALRDNRVRRPAMSGRNLSPEMPSTLLHSGGRRFCLPLRRGNRPISARCGGRAGRPCRSGRSARSRCRSCTGSFARRLRRWTGPWRSAWHRHRPLPQSWNTARR